MRAEASETVLASAEDMANLDLQEQIFPLSGGPGEDKAVLTYSCRDGNEKCVIWFPGRNDMFAHPHAGTHFLDNGFDLYIIEHRRLGRANLGCSAEDFRLVTHTTDFRNYLEEFDQAFDFVVSQKEYAKVVLYAHSTGGLEASLFLREGKLKDRIDAIVLNSPFLDWGEGGFAEMILDAMDDYLMPIMNFLQGKEQAALMDMPGTGKKAVSLYGTRIYLQYPSIDLRCRNNINCKITAGWVAAASAMHDEVIEMTPTDVPTLLLYTDGDVVLEGKEIADRAKYISTQLTTKFFPHCRHDMLLNYDMEDNEKVLAAISEFLDSNLG
eukprot:gnl/TRDRNA2_/TRDRNA2_74616_c0_seq1.p1 gnl/TRDRNA2_/TRDRNA2_74616_c0~~gnl/TRDRNA2_/TRDRNA2_74616_c0_seq1.p1  ORF type:complete len:380 (+),score=70.74 gnl/TRDRNA2_/TRDRNA2_74616_c0_seq1:166-1140(+)